MTRGRVVSNQSCPTSSGLFLNEVPYVESSFQNNIFDIIARFGTYKFAIACEEDISKIYR